MPEISGPSSGCFSKIPRHPPQITKGLFKSTYQDDFLTKFGNFKSCNGISSQALGNSGGISSTYEPLERKHISSKLINERYNNGSELKYNTENQRTWTYIKDPAIEAVETLKIDNASKRPWNEEIKFMSLPMYNDQECQKMRYQINVTCGHKLSDITKKKLKEMAEQKKKKEEIEAAMKFTE